MRYRYIIILMLSLACFGCDGIFERRMLVTHPHPLSDQPAADTAAAVVEITARYARGNSIPCTPRTGTLLFCFDQPVYVYVIATDRGTEVCYSAMGAQFEKSKLESRIDKLQELLVTRFGSANITTSRPNYETECVLNAPQSTAVAPNNSFKPNPLRGSA